MCKLLRGRSPGHSHRALFELDAVGLCVHDSEVVQENHEIARLLKDPTRTSVLIFSTTLAPEVASHGLPAGSTKVKVAHLYLIRMRLKKLSMNLLLTESISVRENFEIRLHMSLQ